MIEFIIANTDAEYKAASLLFREYAAWLNIDLSFQGFDEELKILETMYSAGAGGILLGKIDNRFVACVAIRRINKDMAELKRMFVQPAFRQKGYGKILLEKAIELAKACNYTTIRLDTLNYMTPAIELYKKSGFKEIPAYYHNPNSTAVYFELKY